MTQLAIVGFGFCGVLSFFHLARDANSKRRKIIIFDKDGPEALGPAFSQFSPHYLLNVPANKMSAFFEYELDFCRFVEENYPQIFQEIGEGGFAPRFVYGEYLRQIKQEAFAYAKKNFIDFEFITQEVLEIRQSSHNNFSLYCGNNKSYEAKEIILATSLKQQKLAQNFTQKNFIKNPWNKNFSYFHDKNFLKKNAIKKIALIGSGLTAVDIIVGLKARNFTGEIYIISRRGNFPTKHFSHLKNFPQLITKQDIKSGLLFTLRKIRKFLQKNPQYDIHDVMDSIRSSASEFWRQFDAKNKKSFLKFLLPYWNILRHKMPLSSAIIIDLLASSGQLKIIKGGLRSIETNHEKFLIHTKNGQLQSDCIVNCLGFELNAKKYPLLKQMIAENLLCQDALMCYAVHPHIHLLGGLNIGRDFESTAIPELRKQVEDMLGKGLILRKD